MPNLQTLYQKTRRVSTKAGGKIRQIRMNVRQFTNCLRRGHVLSLQNRGACGKLKQIFSGTLRAFFRETGDFKKVPHTGGRRKDFMKKCNHCGAELAPEETVCPACGEAVADETAAAQTAEEKNAEAAGTEAEAYTCEEEPVVEDGSQEQPQEEPAADAPADAPAQKKKSPLFWVIGALAVVAIVAAILIAGKKSAKAPDADAPAESGVTQTQDGEANTVMHTNEEGFTSYTATEEQLNDATLGLVVASCSGKELTNKSLAFYYWQQYYTFVNNYGTYLSYLLDTTKGLDEQAYSEDETWQQALLSGATDMFHSITALNQEADEAGFELSEEDQAQLDAIPASLDATASYYGLEDGLAYVQSSFGPTVTVEDYVAFARDNLRASRYMQLLVEQMEFTDAEISEYYDQNADSYASSRVLKVDKPMVNVRHILVIPTEKSEDGTSYTDAAWQEAEQKAQALLDEWKAGEATEDSFAALATENSEDPGSASNGGLYEDVYPGQMVDPFDAWCFDDARQTGDTGIVKTDYGYHVMYFVSKGEEIFWFETAKGDLRSERAADLEDALREKYPMDLTLDNAAIFDVQAEEREAANAAAAEAEAEAAQEEASSTQTEEAADAPEDGAQDAENG